MTLREMAVAAAVGVAALAAIKAAVDPEVRGSDQSPNTPAQARAKGIVLENNAYWRETPDGGFAYYATDNRPDAGDRKWVRLTQSPCLMRPRGVLGNLCRVTLPLAGLGDAPVGSALPASFFTVSVGCVEVPCSVVWGEESIMPGSDAGLLGDTALPAEEVQK